MTSAEAACLVKMVALGGPVEPQKPCGPTLHSVGREKREGFSSRNHTAVEEKLQRKLSCGTPGPMLLTCQPSQPFRVSQRP